MADVQPFRAVHYDPTRIDLTTVLAPPYDVISPAERDGLRARSPYNMIHLILGQDHVGSGPQGDSEYEAAGRRWRDWRTEGVLIQDSAPAFHVYEQRFRCGDAVLARTGVIGSVRLEEYSNGVVFPHEKTFAGPKQDRLRLMEAVDANLDSVFGLYDEAAVGVAPLLASARAAEPDLAASSGGQEHRVWMVRDPAAIDALRRAFANARIVIADGHHRYETALAYRDRNGSRRPGAVDRVMMTLVAIDDPGLLVLATHRVVGRSGDSEAARIALDAVGRDFRIEPSGGGAETLERLAADPRSARPACALFFGGAGHLLFPPADAAPLYEALTRWPARALERIREALGVAPLPVGYTHSDSEAIERVESGEAWMALLLKAVPVDSVFGAARAGHLMPEKSTFFNPKLQSGLVMRALDD